jgi:class 3 adenylate cyclase
MNNNQDTGVLVVDDSEEIRSLLQLFLTDAGYDVRLAEDGIEALASVAENPPDLVLLDIEMPNMDGFEACARLQADEKTRDIPIIFLTSLSSLEHIARGFDLGAVDYVTKPFSEAELLARVKTHLRLRQALQRLDQLALDLSKYLSPRVYASIFRGETDVRIESRQKPLTISFIDIVDFTPQVEAREPAELTAWLNNYFNEMAEIVARYGGTLDKYIGDAILVFFGAPESLGEREDAIQCVRMAEEMQHRARELGIGIRVGISSGECTAGNFGSELQMSYTIIGREVNVASRLQVESSPGKILISESTFQLIKNDIACTLNAEIQVKGLQRSLLTYWVSL